MQITNENPQNWTHLQDLVCKYLNEAGYSAESPKTIETVRGEVEVDVFATAKNELIRTFICECKYWNTPVPKEKIHAFRTVVHDSGATLGIFIAKEGYQSGAIEAARCSNVLLKDWNSFLELIKEQWLFQKLLRLKRICHPLGIYTEPLDVPLENLSSEARKRYDEILTKNWNIYYWCRVLSKEVLENESLTICGTCFTACNVLFEYLEECCKIAIAEYKILLKDCDIDQYKFEFKGYMATELMDAIVAE